MAREPEPTTRGKPADRTNGPVRRSRVPPTAAAAAARSDEAAIMERVRRQVSHGPEGDSLLQEVRASTATLAGLFAHSETLGKNVMSGIQATVQDVDWRLQRSELAVVVVGEKHAGKSTFLNALLGDRLFGLTTREPTIVTFLRRADSPGYTARYANGRVEQFTRRCPDRSAELKERVEVAAAAETQAKAEHTAAAREKNEATLALERADAALKAAFRAFEQARDDAARLGDELAAAEARAAQLEIATTNCEARVPVLVRTTPPWWAVWLWAMRTAMVLVTWRAWRAWAVLVRDREDARQSVASLRKATSAAAQTCRSVEVELTPAAGPVDQARSELATARTSLSAREARLAECTAASSEARQKYETHADERRTRFFEDVRALFDVDGRGKDLVELDIRYPARLLPDDVTIIDTPGVTGQPSPTVDRSWKVIREQADGCILISELQRAVNQSTKRFLQQVREVVPHVLLVLTKMDQVFFEALRKGEGEPWEHVEQARRIGTRRFAREIGREPSSVLSVAVAAEPALKKGDGSPLARRFASDTAKLFQLLRHERALILGSRSAGLVRSCIASLVEAEKPAVLAYQRRIAVLEAHRIPDPERFRADQLEAAQPALVEGASRSVAAGLDVLREGIALIHTQCEERIAACSRQRDLQAAVPEIEQTIVQGIERLQHEVHVRVEVVAEGIVGGVENAIFEALRRRYEIAHAVTRGSSSSVRLEPQNNLAEALRVDLAPAVDTALRSLKTFQIGLGVGGATAGGIVGTFILPGIGTAAGVAIGALLTFAKTLGSVKRDLVARVDSVLAGPAAALAEKIQASEAVVLAALGERVERSSEQALVRFRRWIAEPLEAERAAIERERASLKDLQDLRERLQQHDQRLAPLMQAAVDASIGLCR
jgi:GTP-binding protein EngB required for normal cell division